MSHEAAHAGPPPVPVLFQDCFGWYHRPPAASATRRGVVMCGPTGYESISTHRNWRKLAKGLAASGLAVLRYDYPGTGDSAGGEEPDRVPDWLARIGGAAEWLKREAGVEEITLCGLRLGAVLVVLAAAKKSSAIARMALLAPPASGKAFVRELFLKQRLGGSQPVPGWLEVAGFRLHESDLARLRDVDLAAELAAAAVPEVLVLDVPWLPMRGEELAETLRPAGISLTRAPFKGYVEFMRDADLASTPSDDFAFVIDWLRRGAASGVVRPITLPEEKPTMHLPGGVEERAILFGADDGLFGILCRPGSARAERAEIPPVLLLNSGANHHIGNARGTVLLARRLAALGIVSLRMDASGLGDSDRPALAPEGGGADAYRLALLRLYRPEYLDDIRSAIDVLEQRGFRECTIGGVCSGANLALHAALADQRVTGLMLINLPFFERRGCSAKAWAGTPALHALMSRIRRWRRTLISPELRLRASETFRDGRVLMQRSISRANAVLKAATGIDPFVNEANRMMRRLAGRTTRLLFVYSAGDPGLAVFESNFGKEGRRLLRDRSFTLAIMPDADHTFDDGLHRDRLIALLVDHLDGSRSTERAANRPGSGTRAIRSAGRGRFGLSHAAAVVQSSS